MQPSPDMMAVASAIHDAVAPVFLLTGIGAILSVLAGRLARVVDRMRVLNAEPHKSQKEQQEYHTEQISLYRRNVWIHRSITLCTISALFVCLVIVSLFVGTEIMMEHARSVAMMFIAAMVALIFGLLCFLREVALATRVFEPPIKH
ncbi:MAG TPA: DUF2721 domain-containing protein [Methylophilaceae bacterium]